MTHISPYIEQAAERARLPIVVGPIDRTPDGWYVGGPDCCLIATSTQSATRAYVQLRSKLEDGQ